VVGVRDREVAVAVGCCCVGRAAVVGECLCGVVVAFDGVGPGAAAIVCGGSGAVEVPPVAGRGAGVAAVGCVRVGAVVVPAGCLGDGSGVGGGNGERLVVVAISCRCAAPLPLLARASASFPLPMPAAA